MSRWIALTLFLVFASVGCDRKEQSAVGADTSPATTSNVTSGATTTPKEPEAQPTHNLKIDGEFSPGIGDAAGLPEDASDAHKALADIEVSAEVAKGVNDQQKMIVEQVLSRHGVVPGEVDGAATIVITLGNRLPPDNARPMTHSGLLVKVDLQRTDGTHRAASRQVPPANNVGELTANFDHTLDALVRIALEKEE